tara:strand:- start:20880 stop:21116 length:237 start_codon:yes stop_codon:yes gene_type:complete
MKEPQWDDSIHDSKEFFDATVILPDDEAYQSEETPAKETSPKTQFTDLRRRIEERLDSKRIDHEFEFDDLDELLNSMI